MEVKVLQVDLEISEGRLFSLQDIFQSRDLAIHVFVDNHPIRSGELEEITQDEEAVGSCSMARIWCR
jgi:hypothetical protein